MKINPYEQRARALLQLRHARICRREPLRTDDVSRRVARLLRQADAWDIARENR